MPIPKIEFRAHCELAAPGPIAERLQSNDGGWKAAIHQAILGLTARLLQLDVGALALLHLLIEIGLEQLGHPINHVGSIPAPGWAIDIKRFRHDPIEV
jgi:hypothetical protein